MHNFEKFYSSKERHNPLQILTQSKKYTNINVGCLVNNHLFFFKGGTQQKNDYESHKEWPLPEISLLAHFLKFELP